jgi:hypothetical protein
VRRAAEQVAPGCRSDRGRPRSRTRAGYRQRPGAVRPVRRRSRRGWTAARRSGGSRPSADAHRPLDLAGAARHAGSR